MGGSTVGAAIDYLVDGLREPVAAVDRDAEVADCWTTRQTRAYVVIGRSDPESSDSAVGGIGYGSLGHQRLDEQYTIPVTIEAVRDGPAHKPARDAAVALLDVVVKFLHGDPTLGGIVTGGRVAQVTGVELHQTIPRDTNGGVTALRRTTVLLQVTVHNTYIP